MRRYGRRNLIADDIESQNKKTTCDDSPQERAHQLAGRYLDPLSAIGLRE